MVNFEKQILLPYLVKQYNVIKWQNVQKLCVNTFALLYTTSNEKGYLVYVIYLNLFKDHFFGSGIWVSPQPAVRIEKLLLVRFLLLFLFSQIVEKRLVVFGHIALSQPILKIMS